MARGTTTQARFTDIEACTFRIFDAIRKPFAIGQDGSDLDRVLHLRFELATRRAVIANYMNRGSITPGKYADLVMVSDDLFKIPAERIKDAKVMWTMLGGGRCGAESRRRSFR